MPWWTYLAAYLVACVAGWLAVAVCLYVMRWLVLEKERPPFSDWSAFLGGVVERAVAPGPAGSAPCAGLPGAEGTDHGVIDGAPPV
jgi:hypothetical protein